MTTSEQNTDIEREFIQCPHEVGRATCIGSCNCDCDGCAPTRDALSVTGSGAGVVGATAVRPVSMSCPRCMGLPWSKLGDLCRSCVPLGRSELVERAIIAAGEAISNPRCFCNAPAGELCMDDRGFPVPWIHQGREQVNRPAEIGSNDGV